MNIFSVFRKIKKEEPAVTAKKINDTIAAAEGKLPPPNLGISFQCECGRWLPSNLSSFNSIGGKEIMCAHCGAVTFLPPEILDHTSTDLKTATLKQDWQQMIKVVRRGRKE